MDSSNERYVVDERGRRTAVVLPIEEYEELLQDIHDLSIIAERRNEPTISSEELKKTLREDGLLRPSLEAPRTFHPRLPTLWPLKPGIDQRNASAGLRPILPIVGPAM